VADVLSLFGSMQLPVAAVLALFGLVAVQPCLPVLAMLPLELLKLLVSHPSEPLQHHRQGVVAERVRAGHVQPARVSNLGTGHTCTPDSA